MEKVVKNTLETDSRPFVKTVQEIYNISENMEINQMSTRGGWGAFNLRCQYDIIR